VIERLQELGVPPEIARAAHHPAKIWDWCSPEQSVTIIDACTGRETAGSVTEWSWPRDSLPMTRCAGTHDLPLVDVLSIGRRLDRLPEEVLIWTITGHSFDAAAEPTTEVVAAAHRLAERLAAMTHRLVGSVR
jgi:hydrogenase maturation protease